MEKIKEAYEALKNLKTYDITPLFFPNMPCLTTSPGFWADRDCRTVEKDGYFLQLWIMCEHVGSHIDASAHTTKDGPTIETYAPDYFIAPYKKYALDYYNPGAGDFITMKEIKECEERDGFEPEEGDVILLQYGFDKYYFEECEGKLPHGWYGSNAPGIDDEVAEYFVSKKMRAIGADTTNCESPQKDGVHFNLNGHKKYFLPNNIPIMENFVNMGKAPATGLFIALPLPVEGGSGSPVRAILKA